MDLLLSQAYGSDCSDSDSMKGFLDYNLHAASGEVAAVTTANLEEDSDVDVFTKAILELPKTTQDKMLSIVRTLVN
jgi:hypothetical protein